MRTKEEERKVFFIDLISENDNHMVFNASMLKVLLKLMPDREFKVLGIPSNQESFKRLLTIEEENSLSFQALKNPKIETKSRLLKLLNYIRKEVIRYKMFQSILKKSDETDLIFLAITTFPALIAFKTLKKRYKSKVIVVLHGDVDYIYIPSGRMEKINGKAYKKVFKNKLPDFKYLLLNKISKKILIQDGYLEANEVFEIDHPFTFIQKDLEFRDIFQSRPIRIGHIGSMEVERKGSHLIYSLAGMFPKEIEQGQIQFKIVGIINQGFDKYKNKLVDEIVGNKDSDKPSYLGRDLYESELSQLDYCIFFYPEHQYVFRASGAVVDFISKKIPIIVLKHPYFEYLFSIAGNIGFMCDSVDDMGILIKRIAMKDTLVLSQYNEQQKNIEKLKHKFSVQFVSDDLKLQASSFLDL